jgi:hypothetical protein
VAPPDSPADDQWDPTDGEPTPDDSPWWFDPAELAAGGKYGAPPLEPSAEERQREAARLERQRALHERLTAESNTPAQTAPIPRGGWGTAEVRPQRKPRRPSVLRLLLIAAITAMVATGLAFALSPKPTENAASAWTGGDAMVDKVEPKDLPPTPAGKTNQKPVAESATPLGGPPALPTGTGPYRFIAMRPDADAPVAYDPCRPIRYVVNDADAPPNGDRLISDALAEVSAATGLVFKPVGRTDEPPSTNRESVQPDRYGADWAPVLIAWSNPDVVPVLAGAVAGQAGSSSYSVTRSAADGAVSKQSAGYVTGIIMLDGPQIAEIIAEAPDGPLAAQSVVQHEAGHLVGLDHVDDPSQLMYPESNIETTHFGDGDLRGLHELGLGPCIPELTPS